MQKVAQQKQEDQRESLGCWISRPLPPELAHVFNFGRVVCFEPRYPAFVAKTGFDSRSIESTVGYSFRCLNNFVIPEATEGHEIRRFDIASVAMPLLATGNQRVPVEALMPKLLDAAVFWLEEGLPIECLKIVAFTPAEAQVAARIFATRASSGLSLPGGSRGSTGPKNEVGSGLGEYNCSAGDRNVHRPSAGSVADARQCRRTADGTDAVRPTPLSPITTGCRIDRASV